MDWKALKRALMQGGISVFDRDLRRVARKIADFIRTKTNFDNDAYEGLIERLSGVIKGFFGGLVEQNISGDGWKVVFEKGIDLADFITSYVFDKTAGIDEWSVRRLARIRESITDGRISKEDALVLEELFNRLYAGLQWNIDQTAAETPREEIDTQWQNRMDDIRKNAGRPATQADRDIAKTMHHATEALSSMMRSAYDVLWKITDRLGLFVQRASGSDFTEEQECILQAQEAEVADARRQAQLEKFMADNEYLLARVKGRRRRR